MELNLLKQMPKVVKVLVKLFIVLLKKYMIMKKISQLMILLLKKIKKRKKIIKKKKLVFVKLIVKNWIKLFLIIYLLYKLLIYYF